MAREEIQDRILTNIRETADTFDYHAALARGCALTPSTQVLACRPVSELITEQLEVFEILISSTQESWI